MAINFNYQQYLGVIRTPNISANNSRSNIRFGNYQPADTFESNSPKKYTSEISIRNLANSNPKIAQILQSVNAPYSINMETLNHLLTTHATATQEISEGIIQNLPFSLKQKANAKAIQDAAYLHDIGKVFIPEEITNKNGKLTPQEREIMHKHSELGYELLKNTNIDPKVLFLIRNHHQNAQKSGYPKVDNNFFADLDLQILSIADKYSALTEARPYKKPLTREQALTIIRSEVREGKINPLVFNALVAYTDDKILQKTKSLS